MNKMTRRIYFLNYVWIINKIIDCNINVKTFTSNYIFLVKFHIGYLSLVVCLSVFVCSFWNFRCKKKVLTLKIINGY